MAPCPNKHCEGGLIPVYGWEMNYQTCTDDMREWEDDVDETDVVHYEKCPVCNGCGYVQTQFESTILRIY